MQTTDNMRTMNAEDIERSFEEMSRRSAAPTVPPRARPVRVASQHRPAPARPHPTALRYSGTGVRLSRVRGPHRNRPITPVTTVGLALLAALITLWLGVVAQFGSASHGPTAALPEKLAVVQVQAGESLQHVAARVAPGAPVSQVVDRIRDLNELQSVSLDAGQTLISPVG